MNRKEFLRWNEGMFIKYNNVRLYQHPNPLIRYTENLRVSVILNELRDSGKVVDVGCGEGYVLQRMVSPSLVGVDISETAVRRARLVTDAIIVRADAESMPFSASYFDAAVCSETIEHTLNPVNVLKELARITKSDADIILTIPNEPLINWIKSTIWNIGLFNLAFPDVPKRQDDEWHLHSFDLARLKRLCDGIFIIRKVYHIPSRLLPIRYVVVCRNRKKEPTESARLFQHDVKKEEGYYDAL
jgi:SAM-dependent methyltransferase